MKILNRYTEVIRRARSGGLAAQIIQGGIGSTLIRITSVLLGLILTIVFARVLGAEGYGTYAYVFAIVSILSIPAQFGLPRLVIRETAKAQVVENWALIRGLWTWASAVAGLFSVALLAIGMCILWFSKAHSSEVLGKTFFWGLMLIPLLALGNIRGAALQGLRHVVLGQLPETILRPAFLTLFVLITYMYWGAESSSAGAAMFLHVIAALLSFIVGVILLYKKSPEPIRRHPASVYEQKQWLAAVIPLALTSGMLQISSHADIIMLGFYYSEDKVGLYRVATQGAMLVAFGLQIVGMFVSPYFARLRAQGDQERLQRMVTLAARASLAVALPAWIIIYFFGERLLGILFGYDFIGSYGPLIILSSGQLVNALFGAVGILLNMTGHERSMAKSVAVSAALNITLNAILIPPFGMIGAAMATAITLVLWNLYLWQLTYRKLGIDSIAINLRKISL